MNFIRKVRVWEGASTESLPSPTGLEDYTSFVRDRSPGLPVPGSPSYGRRRRGPFHVFFRVPDLGPRVMYFISVQFRVKDRVSGTSVNDFMN